MSVNYPRCPKCDFLLNGEETFCPLCGKRVKRKQLSEKPKTILHIVISATIILIALIIAIFNYISNVKNQKASVQNIVKAENPIECVQQAYNDYISYKNSKGNFDGYIYTKDNTPLLEAYVGNGNDVVLVIENRYIFMAYYDDKSEHYILRQFFYNDPREDKSNTGYSPEAKKIMLHGKKISGEEIN